MMKDWQRSFGGAAGQLPISSSGDRVPAGGNQVIFTVVQRGMMESYSLRQTSFHAPSLSRPGLAAAPKAPINWCPGRRLGMGGMLLLRHHLLLSAAGKHYQRPVSDRC
jgi:hypothetical protein